MAQAKTVARLSTRDAWLHLAGLWDRPEICGCKCGRMTAHGMHLVSGLCAAIGSLKFRGLVTDAQEEQMLAALPRPARVYVEGVRPFLWPTDADGAKARAAFCREQAASYA